MNVKINSVHILSACLVALILPTHAMRVNSPVLPDQNKWENHEKFSTEHRPITKELVTAVLNSLLRKGVIEEDVYISLYYKAEFVAARLVRLNYSFELLMNAFGKSDDAVDDLVEALKEIDKALKAVSAMPIKNSAQDASKKSKIFDFNNDSHSKKDDDLQFELEL